jgi:hypothetical protein
MTRRLLPRRLALALLAGLGCNDRSPSGTDGDGRPYEVWVVDQSDTRGLAHGGSVRVYEGAELTGDAAAVTPVAIIDLAGATSDLCIARTGVAPVRPHVIAFNATGTHAVLSFVGSGHVVLFDAAARAPVGCLRTRGGPTDEARQAHAATPSPDDAFILVANQNGRHVERIAADWAGGRWTLDTLAALDLASCTVPGGAPCQSPATRPDNAPVCFVYDASGDRAWVTLRGGGLVVIDARATPMRVVAAWDSATVHGNGCGGGRSGGRVFVTSGGGMGGHLHEFDLYEFPESGWTGTTAAPAPRLVHTADGEPDRDSHGTAFAGDGRWLWILDRAANVAEVFATGSGARVATVPLAGALSDDPTPDLASASPGGGWLFFTMRGPTPLSADPHVSTGSTPGIGVLRLGDGGRGGQLQRIVRISNLDAGGVERSDPHGIAVRSYEPR